MSKKSRGRFNARFSFNPSFMASCHAADLKERFSVVVNHLEPDELIELDYMMSLFFKESCNSDVSVAFRSCRFFIRGE